MAAALASGGLLATSQPARADGTAAINNMTGNLNWNAAGVWTWTGDTGNQVYPGDGLGDGSEAAIVRPVLGVGNGNRTLTVTSTQTNPMTIGSFTLEQTTPGLTRGLNVNYAAGAPAAKLQLNTSLIQHVEAPGVVSSGGGQDGLQNAMVFNGNWFLNGGNLVLNANLAGTPETTAHINHRANISIKFDDSDVTFTGLTIRGNKSIEFENNNANRVANWNWSGDIRLEGTGQLRIRYGAVGAAGDVVNFGTGLNNLVAAAPGTGYANVNFERVTGSVINRFQFNNTILDSNLFYDPNNAHVALGNIQVNGVRNTFIFDGTAATTANGSSYSGISGDADSEWTINTPNATWTLDKNVQSTMLGKVAVIDGQVGFNANGAMGATGVAKRAGAIDLNVDPVATDLFDIRAQGILRGNGTQFATVSVGTNLTLERGAVIAHETLGNSAAEAATVGNLPLNTAVFGLSADAGAAGSYDISVGGASDLWIGISSERNARRWHQGVITANGDFIIQSGNRTNVGNSLILGNGTNSTGAISIVNNTGNPEVNVTVQNRVDFAHNNASFQQAHFHVTNGTELRLYADNALGGGRATVYPGATIISSSGGNGGSTALNGNVHIMSGGAIQINGRDLTGANAGLNGTGTITRDDNIIVWVNHSEALTGTQFNATSLRNGDLLRLEGDNVKNLDLLPTAIAIQVRGANRTAAANINLDGGGIFTDVGSRTLTGSGVTINVGSNGATFGAATPTVIYDDPHLAPTLNNTGTQTLTITMPVRADAAALAAGSNAGAIRIGTTETVDRIKQMGNVIFNDAFVSAGDVVKITPGDLIFNHPETSIGGNLIAGGGAFNFSPNVKFGNNANTMSGGIVSGTAIAGSLILGSGTKTDLNIDTTSGGNNGPALSNDNRLDVNLKIVVDGGMTTDGRRIYVDRRDSNSAGVGLVNLNRVTINPNAFLSVDEANTDVRIKNPTVLGNFTVDDGAGDAFEIENLTGNGTPITVTNGVVRSAAGNAVAELGLLGTVSSDVTINNVRGQLRLENGVVFNGVVNTQNVPAGGDSWVRVFAGQTGLEADRVSGTGQVNLGGANAGSTGGVIGEDFYVYVNDTAFGNNPIRNLVPLRVNILAGQQGTIHSDRSGTEDTVAGIAEVTGIRMQPDSTLYLGQNADTTLVTDLTLEGNATLKKNDADNTAMLVMVRNVTGPFDLNVNTDSVLRQLRFVGGTVTANRVLVGSTNQESGISLEQNASLPSVEAGDLGEIYIPFPETASVSRIESTNPGFNAVRVDGKLVIRDTGSAATSTTSKVVGLTIPTGGILDIGAGNRLIVDDFPGTSRLQEIRGLILSGRNGGTWDGFGITSSSAAANSKLAVGYGESSSILGPTGGTWGSETADGDAILVRTTLNGDANLDANVNFDDLARLAQNYNNLDGMRVWSEGDFTYDGNVDFDDLALLAQNYNTALPSSAVLAAMSGSASFEEDVARAFAQVPEPGALSVLAVGAAALAGRRRRRR